MVLTVNFPIQNSTFYGLDPECRDMLRDSTPPNKPLYGSIPASEEHLLTGKLQYEHTWSFDSCSPNVRMEFYTKPCATTNDGQHWVNHHASGP